MTKHSSRQRVFYSITLLLLVALATLAIWFVHRHSKAFELPVASESDLKSKELMAWLNSLPAAELPDKGLADLWSDFSHEFDWRIMGPGRSRIHKDGKYHWVQILHPDLFIRYEGAQEMQSWRKLVIYGRENQQESVHYLTDLIQTPSGKPKGLNGYETDLIPFMILQILGEDTLLEKVSASPGDMERFAGSDLEPILRRHNLDR